MGGACPWSRADLFSCLSLASAKTSCPGPPQGTRYATVPRQVESRRDLLRDESGRISSGAPALVALAYPSPYHVAMSSLGFQTIYRAIQQCGTFSCERFVAPDRAIDWNDPPRPVSIESARALSDFPVIALSVAYELEIAGLAGLLHAAGIPPLRRQRDPRTPLVIAGGPLTFSNPLPLGAFVDAIVMGEADGLAVDALRAALGSEDRDGQLRALAALPNVIVPAIHGDSLRPLCQCDDELLPAWAPIQTPHTELRNMFLIEVVRGCSRGCHYCVMRRSTNCGMRVIPIERILERIPQDARRIGLVGASVSDHPKVADLVEQLADRGAQVGLSSLRPDRMSERMVAALKRAGYRTLTAAMDGASERLRKAVDRRTTEQHLLRVAERARACGIERLKLYLMVGLPTETDDDIEECAHFVRGLSRTLPISLGISPFCPKRNTPLADAPFAGARVIEHRLSLLRSRVKGRADVRATSTRWAWVEAVLARGGPDEGQAVLEALQEGGSFASYRRAFEGLGHSMES
ncbi:MAG: radical SAM protein [Deltaproteobacteria bacterium]|nr:radical SAM protein [Deltaproteobacteria bacterium]